MDGEKDLIFTQHIIPNCWIIVILQDSKGNLVSIVEESLESEIEFEMDINLEI